MALAAEFMDANFGDARLGKRLVAVAEKLGERPGDSFPKALSESELEGAYRFFGNEQVSPDAILAPHIHATAARAAQHRTVVVAHDTTQFNFNGAVPRQGLGRLRAAGQGFFGHFSLAIAGDSSREPLGLLGME